MIYTPDNFLFEKAQVGDLVNEAVIDNVIGILPPAYLTATCVQTGEPVATRKDTDGRYRYVYHTFNRLDKDLWVYKGCCFIGGK